MGIFDSIASAVSSFVSSITGGNSGDSKSNSGTTPSSPKPSQTQPTSNGNARSNNAVNSKYNTTPKTAEPATETPQAQTKPKISGTVEGITVGTPNVTPPSGTTGGGNARSNSAVNSKYTAETPTHSSAKDYTNPADTVPKTAAPENKVYDAGTAPAGQTFAVETGFQKNMEAMSKLAEQNTNNTVIPLIDQVVEWRNQQYDKAAGYLEAGNIAGTAATIIPPFLADVVFPIDALNVTNKIGGLIAGTSDTANLTEYELQVGGIDAVVSAIPIIGPAQRLIKTLTKATTKTAVEATETATSRAMKEIAEETGESAISKTVKEGTEEAAEKAVKTTTAYKVARTVDNVAAPLLGTAATFAIAETPSTETPEYTDTDTDEETVADSPFDFSEVPDNIWESPELGGGSAGIGGAWTNYGTEEAPAAYSAGIDAEIDRIIKDYTIPALIALAILAALLSANYALSKGGRTNG